MGRASFVAVIACTGLCAGATVVRAQPVVLDGGLVVASPAALPTGLSMGAGLEATRGGPLVYGVQASWTSATEYALTYAVLQQDMRLRLVGGVQHVAGRGTLALRLGLGGTLVREVRTRDQGQRAGLSGSALEATDWALLPAADLQAAVVLRVAGAWGVALSGGPSLDLEDGTVHAGWIATMGVAWQP